MSIRRFRSQDEIKNAANKVSISRGLEFYHRAARIAGKSCSYSLETMRFYYGDSHDDRRCMLEAYGDGRTVYILAPWTNDRSTLGDSDAQRVCGNIVSMGYVPLIGIWNFKGRVYEEPSFAIDHGVSEATVRDLLQEFSQEAVYRITPDHAESLGRESLGQAD